MLLAEILPALTLELEHLLNRADEPELAATVSQLVIVDRCRCGDDFCASFYTQPKPEGSYGADHSCLDLDASKGMILIDVVSGAIAHVEILNRDEIRAKLTAQFP
ncbi:MAG: hypothetical protein WCA15_09440 [Candidatus Acidiferrales bacterium]